MKAIEPSPEVFSARFDDELVVLHAGDGTYYAFNATAARMWDALVRHGDRDRALGELAGTFGDVPQLCDDFDALTATLVARGFVRRTGKRTDSRARNAGVAPRQRVRTVAPARAWFWLARTAVELRTRGFAAAYRRARLTGDTYPALRDATLLERGVRAFAKAENAFVPAQAPRDCLPRSLALYAFLRETGVDVEHCIGVNRFPFAAHAWVEYDGRALVDKPGTTGYFTPVARLRA
jgi:hypothetical protein